MEEPTQKLKEMKRMKTSLLILILACLCNFAFAQSVVPVADEDTVTINNVLKQVDTLIKANKTDKALELATQARALSVQKGFKKGEGNALKFIGLAHFFKGEVEKAFENWILALEILKNQDDDYNVATLMGNIGAIYAYQEDDAKALEYQLGSLKLGEKMNNKNIQFKALNNIAAVYFTKSATWDKALEYLYKCIAMAREIKVDSSRVGLVYANIGTIYTDKNEPVKANENFVMALQMMGDDDANSPLPLNGLGKLQFKKQNYDQAIYYHKKAVEIADQKNRTLLSQGYIGLAESYFKKQNFELAFVNYNKAEAAAIEMTALTDQKEIYEKAGQAYADVKDFSKAFSYQVKLNKIKDQLYDEKIRKKVGFLQYDFDLAKKQGEVNVLTTEKKLTEANLQKQRTIKWAFTIGFVLILFIAFIIFRNYRAKVKINKILDFQKDQIEALLLNILPSEVARELQDSGQATPRYYESVSVLFTDFKSFTSIADKMSPHELVDELNECFIAFDEITDQFNLEKIKTIGDSYMCAGGIPTPDPDHAFNIIKAGLAIQEYVVEKNRVRRQKGLVAWDIRVGIHSGPVVAGVVGKKKYAYDIWGSTVNIASRMESNGEPGQVNISASTYELIKDKYNCKYRGKIYAKNVGEVDMYFIDEAVNEMTVVEEESNVKVLAESSENKMDIDSLFG
jgi:adenylate cyclase